MIAIGKNLSLLLLGIMACINDIGGELNSRRRRSADIEASIYQLVRLGLYDDVRGLSTENWIPVIEHSSIRFGNFGNTTASCSCLWGTTGEVYHGATSYQRVSKGETAELGCQSNAAFYLTGMKVYNGDSFLVLVFASRGAHPVGPWNYVPENKDPQTTIVYEWDCVELIRTYINLEIAGRSVGSFVAAGFAIQLIVDIFYPSTVEEKDPWEEVKDKVTEEINNAVVAVVTSVLDNDIKPIEFRVKDIKNNINDSDIRRLYINLADQINGYDVKFSFKNHRDVDSTRINIALLPLYTRVINLQINYYYFGITYQEDLKLTDNDVKRLRRYLRAIVPRAVAHVEKSYNERINDVLYNGNLEYFYNYMMRAQSAVELNGRAYYYDWYEIAMPDKLPEVENRTGLGYSEYYGHASPNLYKQAFTYFGAPPLTPRMTGPTTRSQWSAFRVYKCWNINLCGIQLWFDNGDYAELGRLWDAPQSKVEFNGRRVMSLLSCGWGTVRGLIFTFDDKEVLTYGHSHDVNPHVFSKPYYYIASMFAANDLPRLGDQIVNVAVSYQMHPDTYKRDNETLSARMRDLLKESNYDSTY